MLTGLGVRGADASNTVLRRRVPVVATVVRCVHIGSRARLGKSLLLVPRRSRTSKAEGHVGSVRAQRPSSRLSLTHALESEVHSLQIRLRAEGAAFDKWRRQNIAWFLTIGGVAGGLTLAILGTVYVRRHPYIIDYVIAWLAKVEFDATTTYQSRKQLYMDVPEPQFSVSSLEAKIKAALLARSASGSSQAADNERFGELSIAWANMTSKAFTAMGGSWLLATKAAMRRELIDEVCSLGFSPSKGVDDTAGQIDASAVIATKLAELRDILPQSLERNTYVAEELSKYMDACSPADRCAYACGEGGATAPVPCRFSMVAACLSLAKWFRNIPLALACE